MGSEGKQDGRKRRQSFDFSQQRIKRVNTSSENQYPELNLKFNPENVQIKDTEPIDEKDESKIARTYRYLPDSEKFKISIVPASRLEVGYWKREAQSDNDIVAKFLFSRKAIAWEVLSEGKIRKMQMFWTDISALRATFAEGKPSTLEIEVGKPPAFFVQLQDPDPRRHVIWIRSDDFTGGHASSFRRHRLTVAEGVLEKHFEKLVYSSGHLYVLNQKPFWFHNPPFFNHNHQQTLPYVSQFVLPALNRPPPYANMIHPQLHAVRVTPLRRALPESPLNSEDSETDGEE